MREPDARCHKNDEFWLSAVPCPDGQPLEDVGKGWAIGTLGKVKPVLPTQHARLELGQVGSARVRYIGCDNPRPNRTYGDARQE